MPGKNRLGQRFVLIERDVFRCGASGGQQDHDAVCREPAFFDELGQHGLAVCIDLLSLLTHHFVFQDGRVRAGQVPGLEERRPVNGVDQLFQRVGLENPSANGLWRWRRSHLNLGRILAGLLQADDLGRLFGGVTLSKLGVILQDFAQVFGFLVRVTGQRLRHRHRARSIGHPDDRT